MLESSRMSLRLRSSTAPILVETPRGVRIRTRLRVTDQDAPVLWALGQYLGCLASGGAIRYDISYQPERGHWYLDASWRLPAAPLPELKGVLSAGVLGVDLYAGHLAAWLLEQDGSPLPAADGSGGLTGPADLDSRREAASGDLAADRASSAGRDKGDRDRRPQLRGGSQSGSGDHGPRPPGQAMAANSGRSADGQVP